MWRFTQWRHRVVCSGPKKSQAPTRVMFALTWWCVHWANCTPTCFCSILHFIYVNVIRSLTVLVKSKRRHLSPTPSASCHLNSPWCSNIGRRVILVPVTTHGKHFGYFILENCTPVTHAYCILAKDSYWISIHFYLVKHLSLHRAICLKLLYTSKLQILSLLMSILLHEVLRVFP